MSARRVLGLWAPVLLYLCVLFFLSSQSRPPTIELVWDKLLHVGGYLPLSILVLRAFHGGLRPLRWRPALQACLFTVGYGVTDEFHQAFVPGRTASSLDVVADAVGFLLAVVLLFLRYQGLFGTGELSGGKEA